MRGGNSGGEAGGRRDPAGDAASTANAANPNHVNLDDSFTDLGSQGDAVGPVGVPHAASTAGTSIDRQIARASRDLNTTRVESGGHGE